MMGDRGLSLANFGSASRHGSFISIDHPKSEIGNP